MEKGRKRKVLKHLENFLGIQQRVQECLELSKFVMRKFTGLFRRKKQLNMVKKEIFENLRGTRNTFLIEIMARYKSIWQTYVV